MPGNGFLSTIPVDSAYMLFAVQSLWDSVISDNTL